jgi:hypothetical protein
MLCHSLLLFLDCRLTCAFLCVLLFLACFFNLVCSGRHGHSHRRHEHDAAAAAAEANSGAIMRQQNPIKVLALRHEAVIGRATASLCSQAAIVVRHRIAVETSPWSADQVATQVLQQPLPSSLESIAVRDASFAAMAEQEAQERAGTFEAQKNGSAATAAAAASSGGGRPLTASRTGRLHVTGGRLPLSSPEVYKVDVSCVPVLFSRAVVKAACSATKRGGPDAALASLHASPRAVALLHGPTHLTKLGLAGALPLVSSQVANESNAAGDSKFFPTSSRAATAALTNSSKNADSSGEVEAALSASKNDLPAALDLLVLDSKVMQRAAAWRCQTRISEALGPAAALAFQASAKREGGSGDMIARALAEAHTDGEAAAREAVAAAQAVANEKAAAAAEVAASEGAGAAEEGGDAAAASAKIAPANSAPVVAPPVDPEAVVAAALQAARDSGDLDLAQLLAIGFAPAMPEITTLCPRAAAVEEGGKHAKGHRAKSSSRGGGSGSPSKGKNSPKARGKEIEESESLEERAAARRFEAMAFGVARARRIADRASQQLLLPPRAGDLRLQRPPPLSRPATTAAAAASSAAPANDDPSLDAWAVPATDGRIASLRSICAPTPWLFEARASVVQAVAVVVAAANNGLPQEVETQLDALWHNDKLFEVVSSGGKVQGEKGEETKVSEAKSDLAGLLPNWLLDAAVSRAVVRESTVEHVYRPPPSKETKKSGAGEDVPAAPPVAETPTPKGGKKGAKAAPAAAAAAAPAAAVAEPSSGAAPSGNYSFEVPPGPRIRAPPCPARPWPLLVSEEDAAVASSVAVAEQSEEDSNFEDEAATAAAQAQALADRLASTPSGPAVAPTGGPGCAAAVRWRYIVCEAVRALLCDDATVLKQVSYRKVQRLLATSLPFTRMAPELLRAAWNLAGGNVQRAAALVAKDARVLENGWLHGEAPLGRLMQTLTGAANNSSSDQDAATNNAAAIESNDVFRGAAEVNDDAALRPKDWDEGSMESGNSDDDDNDDILNSPLQIEAAPEAAAPNTPAGGENPSAAAVAAPIVEGAIEPSSASSSRGSLRRRPSASSRSSRPPNGGWTLDALLAAADRGAQSAAAAAASITTTALTKGGKKGAKGTKSARAPPPIAPAPTLAPIRQLLPVLRARASWLSAIAGVPISDHDLVFVLLQAALGLPHYCALPCPPHLEATQQAAAAATASVGAAVTSEQEAAMPTIKESQGGDASVPSDAANPFPGSEPGQQPTQAPQLTPSQESGVRPSPTAVCDVQCAVAFERLYALPQVNAGTSLATRGAIAYQRKLDLARVVPEAEAAKRARDSVNKSNSAVASSSNVRGKGSGKAASRSGSTRGSLATSGQGLKSGADAAMPAMSDMSERLEVTIPRLGWWCVNECAPPPALLRGRLVFATSTVDALFGELFLAPSSTNFNNINGIGGSIDFGSATVGSGGSVSSRSSASTGGDRLAQLRNKNNNSPQGKGSFDGGIVAVRAQAVDSSNHNDDHATATASFFANSRGFFDPSLPAPAPRAPQALAARANLLLSRLLVVATSNAATTGGFTSPPAVLGVVQTGLDEIVVCFAADALAGSSVKLEVSVDVGDLQSVGPGAITPMATQHTTPFGPYEVPTTGGEMLAGELLFPAPKL